MGMVIGIVGSLGSGKTCMMTRIGLTNKLLNPDMHIYSNYHLKNISYDKLDIMDMYLNNRSLNNCIILADEIYTFMDCRVSGKLRNRIESYYIAMTRKKNNTFIFTSQYERFFDLRLSLFTNINIIMNNYWQIKTRSVNGVIYKIKVSHPYLFEANFIDRRDNKEIIKRFDGRRWFKEYDTEEVIYPPEDYLQPKKNIKQKDTLR